MGYHFAEQNAFYKLEYCYYRHKCPHKYFFRGKPLTIVPVGWQRMRLGEKIILSHFSVQYQLR